MVGQRRPDRGGRERRALGDRQRRRRDEGSRSRSARRRSAGGSRRAARWRTRAPAQPAAGSAPASGPPAVQAASSGTAQAAASATRTNGVIGAPPWRSGSDAPCTAMLRRPGRRRGQPGRHERDRLADRRAVGAPGRRVDAARARRSSGRRCRRTRGGRSARARRMPRRTAAAQAVLAIARARVTLDSTSGVDGVEQLHARLEQCLREHPCIVRAPGRALHRLGERFDRRADDRRESPVAAARDDAVQSRVPQASSVRRRRSTSARISASREPKW